VELSHLCLSSKKPWISKEVKSLIRKRNKHYKKYKKTKDKMDLKRYKETKAHLQKAERQSYWKYINNIIEIGDPDQEDRSPKQKFFWSYIKSLRKDTNRIAPLKAVRLSLCLL
jgi:hypothetical protein